MKNFVAVSCLLLCVVASQSVEASTFTLSSVKVDLRDHDPGLVLAHSDPWTGNIDLNGVGASATKELFKIGTREEALNLDDLWPFEINVGLGFSKPSTFSGSVGGFTGAGWIGKGFGGYVHWDDPIQLAFGPTGAGLLEIALTNVTFGLPGYSSVFATFTLKRDATSVPEPATLALLGIGAAVAAVRRRRQLR